MVKCMIFSVAYACDKDLNKNIYPHLSCLFLLYYVVSEPIYGHETQ